MTNLLRGTPGETYTVSPGFTEAYEEATADDQGILRDDDGRAYSAGVYEIIED